MDRSPGAVTFAADNVVLVVRVPDPAAAAVLASAYLPVRGVAGDVVTFAADPFAGTVAVAYASWEGSTAAWVMSLEEFTGAVASWVRRPPGRTPGVAWRRLRESRPPSGLR